MDKSVEKIKLEFQSLLLPSCAVLEKAANRVFVKRIPILEWEAFQARVPEGEVYHMFFFWFDLPKLLLNLTIGH